MSREQQQQRTRLNGSHNIEKKQQVDLRMLNQHAKKINAEYDRLEKDRLELMNQRQESTQLTFGQRQAGSDAPSRQEYSTDRSDRIERNFNRPTDNRRHYGVPDTIIEESSRRQDRPSTYESVHSLKAIIDRLVEESKVENEAVRARLREVQRKHQEVLNDLQPHSTKHTTVRQTALPDCPRPDKALITVEQEYSNPNESHKPIKTDTEGARATLNQRHIETGRHRTQARNRKDSDSIPLEYTDEAENETIEIDYRRDIPVGDSFATLNILEGRIFSQIVALREAKVKLMHSLNIEVSNYNAIMDDFRQLENENKHLKKRLQIAEADAVVNIRQQPSEFGHKHRPSNNEKRNGSSFDVERLENDNARLREKLKKAAAFIQRANLDSDGQGVREDQSELQRNLRNAEAEIERLERELNNRQKTGSQPTNHHDDEINDLRQALRQAQSNIEHLTIENRRLESRGGASNDIYVQLQKLRSENDRLRGETIDMLRAAETTRHRESNRPNESWAPVRTSPRYGPSYSRQ